MEQAVDHGAGVMLGTGLWLEEEVSVSGGGLTELSRASAFHEIEKERS